MRRAVALAPVALLAGLLVGLLWHADLREALVRPAVALALYAHHYLTHMPQTVLWFLTLALLAWPLLRLALRRQGPAFGRRARAEPAVARGPVSAWVHTLTLALDGPLYRRRVRRYLRRHGAEAVEPEGREGRAAFLRSVQAALEALEEEDHERRSE